MNEVIASDMAIATLTLALALIYAAWHEGQAKNTRDARLLSAMGAASLMGSVVAWLL